MALGVEEDGGSGRRRERECDQELSGGDVAHTPKVPSRP
jgi:hypothetical protein